MSWINRPHVDNRQRLRKKNSSQKKPLNDALAAHYPPPVRTTQTFTSTQDWKCFEPVRTATPSGSLIPTSEFFCVYFWVEVGSENRMKKCITFFAHLPHISLPGSGPKNVQKTPLARDVCTKPICLPKRAFSRTRRLFEGRTKSERQVSLSNWRGWWQTSPVPRVLLEVYLRTSATFVKEASELTQKSVIKTASNSTSFKKGGILSQRQERQKIEQLRNYE